MTGRSKLQLRKDGAVARLVIDHERQHNVLTFPVVDALASTLADLERDPSVRVAVITGAGGKAFSAGFDIQAIDSAGEVSGDGLCEADRRLARAFRAIEAARFPVIAQINGHCVGGGLELAMACDLRIAAADARFRMPPVRLGWVYTAEGLRRFTSAIGVARTRYLFLTGEAISAQRAESWGLVDEVVAPGAIGERVDTLCRTLAAAAPISLHGTKQALAALGRADMPTAAWEEHIALRRRALTSDDLMEGRQAFLERRPPDFQGR